MTEQKNITSQIMDKIKAIEPKSKFDIILEKIFLYTSMFLLLIISSYFLSWFFIDLLVDNSNFTRFDFYLQFALWEYLFISIFMAIIIYKLYRKTDLPFVKNRVLLFFSIYMLCILAAFSLFTFAVQQNISNKVFPQQMQRQRNLPPKNKDNLPPRRLNRLAPNPND